MAGTKIANRLALFKKKLVDDNLEYDYLANLKIDFESFPTAEFQYRVKQYVIGRPDLISYEVYQNVNLWWLIALRNNIMDPFDEIQVGDILFIPALNDYYDFFNRNITIEEPIDRIFDQRQFTD